MFVLKRIPPSLEHILISAARQNRSSPQRKTGRAGKGERMGECACSVRLRLVELIELGSVRDMCGDDGEKTGEERRAGRRMARTAVSLLMLCIQNAKCCWC